MSIDSIVGDVLEIDVISSALLGSRTSLVILRCTSSRRRRCCPTLVKTSSSKALEEKISVSNADTVISNIMQATFMTVRKFVDIVDRIVSVDGYWY